MPSASTTFAFGFGLALDFVGFFTSSTITATSFSFSPASPSLAFVLTIPVTKFMPSASALSPTTHWKTFRPSASTTFAFGFGLALGFACFFAVLLTAASLSSRLRRRTLLSGGRNFRRQQPLRSRHDRGLFEGWECKKLVHIHSLHLALGERDWQTRRRDSIVV
ncbi:hypothetical protein BZA05DRAFT_401822 [Tricharina praecox]|uniref:uncharacterized protein n=1 Tax=Tricharina praecox TaxID=43433 RepID=UPI00221EA200|nr:uncharacterized protein BZA05DRAFT_401822 [Tricharina praecox]KAI5849874.1 hypothetical protein BZA05DRAFT_401822 [Tricharina praecox]